jgi:hypothetical protein
MCFCYYLRLGCRCVDEVSRVCRMAMSVTVYQPLSRQVRVPVQVATEPDERPRAWASLSECRTGSHSGLTPVRSSESVAVPFLSIAPDGLEGHAPPPQRRHFRASSGPPHPPWVLSLANVATPAEAGRLRSIARSLPRVCPTLAAEMACSRSTGYGAMA